jgi:hypothetical protein
MKHHPALAFLPALANPDSDSADAAEDQSPEIAFTPVPRLRKRRNGWSAERQRMFIAALAGCGSVARAARSVGMTPRSAYRLLDADGADSFAAAWDTAFAIGFERVRADALERAVNGAPVAIYRRGKLVRVEQRRNDRLAIALLGGRDRLIDDYRRTAVARRAYRLDLAAADAAKAAAGRRADSIWAQHQAILDSLEAAAAEPAAESAAKSETARASAGAHAAAPRVRRL